MLSTDLKNGIQVGQITPQMAFNHKEKKSIRRDRTFDVRPDPHYITCSGIRTYPPRTNPSDMCCYGRCVAMVTALHLMPKRFHHFTELKKQFWTNKIVLPQSPCYINTITLQVILKLIGF